jgi:hypothetical protein
MGTSRISADRLRGISFSIADLILVEGWSKARGLWMVVRLDHASETEEYEEVLAFHSEIGQPCRWMMWRDSAAVFVQPLLGRTQRYGSVAEALDALTPRQSIVLTDVMALRWPNQVSRLVALGRAGSLRNADAAKED